MDKLNRTKLRYHVYAKSHSANLHLARVYCNFKRKSSSFNIIKDLKKIKIKNLKIIIFFTINISGKKNYSAFDNKFLILKFTIKIYINYFFYILTNVLIIIIIIQLSLVALTKNYFKFT